MEKSHGNESGASHDESFKGYTEEAWALHEGLWDFDPEGHPLRFKNEAGGYDVVYFDSNYRPIKRVPLAPNVDAEQLPHGGSQQPSSTEATGVESQTSDPTQHDVPPVPEG